MRVEDDVTEVLDNLDVADRIQRLDAPIEVALHQVGAPDVHLLVPTVVEPENTGVLEEAADNGPDGDVVADAGNAGTQAADAAYDQVDADACLRCAIEDADHLIVGDGVHLDDDVRSASPLRIL